MITILISCNSSDDTIESNDNQMTALLEASQKACDSSIAAIFEDARVSGEAILKNNYSEEVIRNEMKALLAKYATIVEVVFVNKQDTIKYIEPEAFRYSEGSDISTQEHQMQIHSTNQNAVSGIIKLVEGYYAVVLASPVLQDGKMNGSINILIKPNYFIPYHTDKYVKNNADDFVVMETNGNMIYDLDSTQSGKNMFTDSLYMPYPELIAAGHTIIAGESGKTYYSFLDKGKSKNVYKDVWWKTSNYYGRIWKYSIIKEKI